MNHKPVNVGTVDHNFDLFGNPGPKTVILNFVKPDNKTTSQEEVKADVGDVRTDASNVSNGIYAIEFEGGEEKTAKIDSVTLIYSDNRQDRATSLEGDYKKGTRKNFIIPGGTKNLKQIIITGNTDLMYLLSGRLRINVYNVLPK